MTDSGTLKQAVSVAALSLGGHEKQPSDSVSAGHLMNHSVPAELGQADSQTTDVEAGIRPPGHNGLTRRSAMKTVPASAGAAASVGNARSETQDPKPDPRRGSPKRYAMKKSINLWASLRSLGAFGSTRGVSGGRNEAVYAKPGFFLIPRLLGGQSIKLAPRNRRGTPS